jgi:hypothetical protein
MIEVEKWFSLVVHSKERWEEEEKGKKIILLGRIQEIM